MRAYEEVVELYRRTSCNESLSNGSISHARVLVDNIIIAAIDRGLELKIFSGSLREDFYSNFIEKIGTLLEANKVDVILHDGASFDSQNKVAKLIASSKNGTVKVTNRFSGLFHFILAGDSIYRIETNHTLGLAEANFNDSLVGKWLLRKHQEIDADAVDAYSFKLGAAAQPEVLDRAQSAL